MKEQNLHNSIVDYLNYYPHILWTSTLGGVYLGKRNYKQKALVKKHYKKGVPDLLIFEPNKKHNGLMVELKVKYNKPSKDQKLWLANLTARGYKAVVCYSLEEFIEIIDEDEYIINKIDFIREIYNPELVVPGISALGKWEYYALKNAGVKLFSDLWES